MKSVLSGACAQCELIGVCVQWVVIVRGVEIAKFDTCPGISKLLYCTCPKKVLLVPKRADHVYNAQKTLLSPKCA